MATARTIAVQSPGRSDASNSSSPEWSTRLVTSFPSPGDAAFDARVRDLVAVLDVAFAAPPSRDELAARVGLSVSRLQHVFRAQVGVSIGEYITARRLTVARRLLLDRRLRISEVSSQVGFGHPSSFTHVFTRETHPTPHQYRRGNPGPARRGSSTPQQD